MNICRLLTRLIVLTTNHFIHLSVKEQSFTKFYRLEITICTFGERLGIRWTFIVCLEGVTALLKALPFNVMSLSIQIFTYTESYYVFMNISFHINVGGFGMLYGYVHRCVCNFFNCIGLWESDRNTNFDNPYSKAE